MVPINTIYKSFWGPNSPNAFLCFHEQIYMDKWLPWIQFTSWSVETSICCRKYVDDIIGLFHLLDHLEEKNF